ncbi:MAG: AsmA-like C-terminal domain-containing protein [Smithella sp.]
MMAIKKRTLIKVLLIPAIALAALIAFAWFYIYHELSHLENYKDSITQAVGETLQRNVTYESGKASLTIRGGLALRFTNLVIKEKDRSADLLNIKTAFFQMGVLPLLRNRLIFREVVLDQPCLSLKRDRTGSLNIADLLEKEQKPKIKLEFQKLVIAGGLITFLDQAAGEKDLTTSLTNLSCRIDKSRRQDASTFSITASVKEDKNLGVLTFAGTFRPAPDAKPLTESTVDASLRLNGMDIGHYRPYLSNYAPLEKLAGRLDVETAFSGTLANFAAKGTVLVKNAVLHYPQVFRGTLQTEAVHVDYALMRKGNHLKLDITHFAVDRFSASGRLDIKELDKEDPLLSATAKTSTFSLKEVQSNIPWKIIPVNVGRFIETHIKNGDFRLVEGNLNGRLSQIAHMEKQGNAGVLSIQAEVHKGIFVVDDKTPVFQDISGILELKNRQFVLKKMTGRFGSSPCTLEGNISDFALPGPAVYTANMTLQPSRDQILWLLGRERFRHLSFQRASTLELSGKGPAENYRIAARWDLTNTAYAYPEIIEKPRGRANRLLAEVTLNEKVLIISSFDYDLPPVNVKGSALFSFAGGKNVALSIKSQTFDIREAVSILPVLRTYDPAGTCLIAVDGRGDPDNPGSFLWKGDVSLNNVSFKPSESIKRIRGLTGKVVLTGKRIETSRFSARVGRSAVSGKCLIDDLSKTKLDCQLDSALFRTADIGLLNPEGEVNFHKVTGRVIVKDEHIRIDRLSLGLGKSVFNLSGEIRNFTAPKIAVSLNSPYMSFDDVAILTTLKPSGQKVRSLFPAELTTNLQIEAGAFQDINFKKLKADLKFVGETLDVKALEAGIFEGKLTGRGKADIRRDGQNRYAATFSLDKVSLDKIQKYLKMGEREVTGNLSLTGNITASGRNTDDLMKTAAGIFKVQAHKGVLKRFSVFSKIFSLLNVLQLARFQLPDMAVSGMPYNGITGDLTLKGGVLSSEDFFISSDAMQISAAGKVNLLTKQFDNIVGVHPLGTLDKIVAKLPVAGWLLTDEKGNLITVHFRVEGKWGDPKVTPIPVQSVGQGTLDIFWRLFQLPVKLVTDTGEVILGH